MLKISPILNPPTKNPNIWSPLYWKNVVKFTLWEIYKSVHIKFASKPTDHSTFHRKKILKTISYQKNVNSLWIREINKTI